MKRLPFPLCSTAVLGLSVLGPRGQQQPELLCHGLPALRFPGLPQAPFQIPSTFPQNRDKVMASLSKQGRESKKQSDIQSEARTSRSVLRFKRNSTNGYQPCLSVCQSTRWLPGCLSVSNTCWSPCWHPGSSQLFSVFPRPRTSYKLSFRASQSRITTPFGPRVSLVLSLSISVTWSPPSHPFSFLPRSPHTITTPHPLLMAWSSLLARFNLLLSLSLL